MFFQTFFVLLLQFYFCDLLAQENVQVNEHVADVKISFLRTQSGATSETHYHPGDVVQLCLYARTKNKKESDFIGNDPKNKSDKNHSTWKDFTIQVKGGTYKDGAVTIDKVDARYFTKNYLVVTAVANNDHTIKSSDSIKVYFDGTLIVDFSGATGAAGVEGSRGVRIIGREGIDGDSGGDGGDGSDGENINVFVSLVDHDGVPHLQICVQSANLSLSQANSRKYYCINAKEGYLVINANGGKGGYGANGKRGSSGKDARDETDKKSGHEAGVGGNGGDGGNGGKGGMGGSIHVFVDSSAIPFLSHITFKNEGGKGGDAGSAGSGGFGGSSSTNYPAGKNGNDGANGIHGFDGLNGKAVEIKIMRVERLW